MAHNPAHFETTESSDMNMIRQQKYTSPAAAKKAAAALRAQLHQELESKKLCAYQPHECSQLTLEGYDYCLRHIMEDKTAPFKQCNYVFNNNGKRCHLPAPKGEKKEHVYCSDHAFKCHLTRVRAAAKHQPANSMESLLDSLSHYVAPTGIKSSSITPDDLDDLKEDTENENLKSTPCLNPFTDIDAFVVNSTRNRVLDYGSESESDVEPTIYSNVWHDAHADSSDDESIDSEQEDVLKHAGIYTAEEVTLVTRDKLIRLQSLYIEQFKHLQHILKERRRKYLLALKREKDTYSSIHDQIRETPKEKRLYNKLKALNHYHRKHGIDAIMNKKFTELRAKLTEGANVKPAAFSKCTYVEGGVKCTERSLPAAKHCRKHILNDRNQVLFKRCNRIHADTECNEPVLAIFKEPMCKYHMDYPPIRHYGAIRTFDDSDMENSSDTHDQHALDLLASSSCDSKAPTMTSAQFVDFANQFPSSVSPTQQKMEIMDNCEDYKDVSNEIDVTQADNNMHFALSGQEESNSSMNTIKIEQTETEVPDIDNNETIDTELSVIDPDDDMAGIMLELQKGKITTKDDQQH